MKKILCMLLMAVAMPLFAAQTVYNHGDWTVWEGNAGADDAQVIETSDLSGKTACMIHSEEGSVDVYVAIDELGTHYAEGAYRLQDHGAASNSYALSTTAGKVYAFVGHFRRVKVLQNGATAAVAYLRCWQER